jgi:hypothetical protein
LSSFLALRPRLRSGTCEDRYTSPPYALDEQTDGVRNVALAMEAPFAEDDEARNGS